MKMERVIANSPCYRAIFGVRMLVCLTLDAQIHDVVTADGTVVDDDIPRPQ